MSDTEYDRLYDALEALEEKTGVVMSNSPTRKVGAQVVDNIPKVTHKHLMLSLDKVHTAAEITRFAGNNDVIAMMKMDGLTCSATYFNGDLVQLETRGDGYHGNNITHLAAAFENLPAKINRAGTYVIDGEAIITYEDFDTINKKISNPDDKYKNPRNLAAGTLSLLDCNIAKERHLKFIAWDVISGDDENDFVARLDTAKSLGFTIVPYYELNLKDQKCFDNIREDAKSLGYPIDGVVVKMRNIAYGKTLGRTDKFFRNAIAYKFEDDKYPTKLTDVVWQVGKTGVITPVIITEPVEIEGSTVNRASVHNISIFKQLHFTKGCTCYLYKANMIIPQCDSTEDDGAEEIEIPDKCPICVGDTKITKDNNSEILVCSNPSCPGKLLGRLKHFVSKKGMDIDGLSEATLEKFIDFEWVENLYDIYHLEDHYKELTNMPGFGKRSVEKLKKSIEESKNVELGHFITSLSIPGIGEGQTKVIAKKFKTWEEFAAAGSGDYDFSKLPGIGDNLNRNIHKWFKSMYYTDQVEYLAAEMNFVANDKAMAAGTVLSGKTFVITGSLMKFSNRDEMKEKIESLGGKVSGSVSKNTSYLINNDNTSNSSKNKKAQELKIPIITEEEFIEMIKEQH